MGWFGSFKRLAAAAFVTAALTAIGALPLSAHAESASNKAKAAKTAKKPATGAARNAASAKTRSKTPVRSTKVVPARTVAKVAPHKPVVVAIEPAKASFGQIYGLHRTDDPLDLKSSVALVIDQDTDQVLLSKNPHAVLPIASITKLMTGLVVTEAHQSLDDVLTITQDDVDTEKGSSSRLLVGTQLTRGEMLHLALMSSENRAANALGRHYPGGLPAFVQAMNAKAQLLGMHDTRYVEPTGLSSNNQSSARDLAVLVKAAYQHPILRELTTSTDASVAVGRRQLQFHTTNGLVRNPSWDIGLQKTGYISEAGRCLVMQAQLAGRKLIMVLLDSAGKYSRIGDAERIRKWLTSDGSPVLQSGVKPASLSN
ncbi:D-alanyl-D-alanine endopeptidase, PbpG [Rubrivivax gelatinosus IL144]|uniref:D-alanyl-D-alanine endopeptidase, PbpG n=1 Tax=Rubrivivax gelatinosus (strain NBRC 100245 / IL144) TaxID=983917 RepID=I0HT04_RUBGI|nr:D-alanyl-D-alanine endopeptidase, PbpG [Rubrivivax gelatinosus IL144]